MNQLRCPLRIISIYMKAMVCLLTIFKTVFVLKTRRIGKTQHTFFPFNTSCSFFFQKDTNIKLKKQFSKNTEIMFFVFLKTVFEQPYACFLEHSLSHCTFYFLFLI